LRTGIQIKKIQSIKKKLNYFKIIAEALIKKPVSFEIDQLKSYNKFEIFALIWFSEY